MPRRRKIRPVKPVVRVPMAAPVRPNQGWALDFTHEQLDSGPCFRILTIIDEFTREIVLTHAAASFKGADVQACFSRALTDRGLAPNWVRSDNGSELIAGLSEPFLRSHGTDHVRSRPGTPTDNAKVESFHSRFRDEFLDRTLFSSVPDTNRRLLDFKFYYNTVRPHSSIEYLTPAAFHERHRSLQSEVAPK